MSKLPIQTADGLEKVKDKRESEPQVNLRSFCLLSLERGARRGSSPVSLRLFVLSLEKGKQFVIYSLRG